MTIYKALKGLSHLRTGAKLKIGDFCTDNPDADEVTSLSSGAVFYDGYLSNRPQNDINILLGYALDIVDSKHQDYQYLLKSGLISDKKTENK